MSSSQINDIFSLSTLLPLISVRLSFDFSSASNHRMRLSMHPYIQYMAFLPDIVSMERELVPVNVACQQSKGVSLSRSFCSRSVNV